MQLLFYGPKYFCKHYWKSFKNSLNHKSTSQQEVSPGKEESGLTGRERDLEKVMAMLIKGSSRFVNLHGISGVGKTKLIIETVSKWPGNHRKERLSFSCFKRFSTRQNDHKFRSKSGGWIIKKVEVSRANSDILLLLYNVDKFAEGDDEASISLNANFLMFLRGLLGLKDYPGKSKLKILLTSRSEFYQVFFSKIRELAAFERIKWRNCCRCAKGIPSSLREWQLSWGNKWPMTPGFWKRLTSH